MSADLKYIYIHKKRTRIMINTIKFNMTYSINSDTELELAIKIRDEALELINSISDNLSNNGSEYFSGHYIKALFLRNEFTEDTVSKLIKFEKRLKTINTRHVVGGLDLNGNPVVKYVYLHKNKKMFYRVYNPDEPKKVVSYKCCKYGNDKAYELACKTAEIYEHTGILKRLDVLPINDIYGNPIRTYIHTTRDSYVINYPYNDGNRYVKSFGFTNDNVNDVYLIASKSLDIINEVGIDKIINKKKKYKLEELPDSFVKYVSSNKNIYYKKDKYIIIRTNTQGYRCECQLDISYGFDINKIIELSKIIHEYHVLNNSKFKELPITEEEFYTCDIIKEEYKDILRFSKERGAIIVNTNIWSYKKVSQFKLPNIKSMSWRPSEYIEYWADMLYKDYNNLKKATEEYLEIREYF